MAQSEAVISLTDQLHGYASEKLIGSIYTLSYLALGAYQLSMRSHSPSINMVREVSETLALNFFLILGYASTMTMPGLLEEEKRLLQSDDFKAILEYATGNPSFGRRLRKIGESGQIPEKLSLRSFYFLLEFTSKTLHVNRDKMEAITAKMAHLEPSCFSHEEFVIISQCASLPELFKINSFTNYQDLEDFSRKCSEFLTEMEVGLGHQKTGITIAIDDLNRAALVRHSSDKPSFDQTTFFHTSLIIHAIAATRGLAHIPYDKTIDESELLYRRFYQIDLASLLHPDVEKIVSLPEIKTFFEQQIIDKTTPSDAKKQTIYSLLFYTSIFFKQGNTQSLKERSTITTDEGMICSAFVAKIIEQSILETATFISERIAGQLELPYTIQSPFPADRNLTKVSPYDLSHLFPTIKPSNTPYGKLAPYLNFLD